MAHLYRFICTAVFFVFIATHGFGQQGAIRGVLLDAETGDPIPFGSVALRGESRGAVSDIDGFFSLTGLEAGNYILVASYLGYDSTLTEVILASASSIVNVRMLLVPASIELAEVEISGEATVRRTEVLIGQVRATKAEIQALPATGAEPDIAQYLQVVPGVISTGDQGGQLYIRGGAPVQNKILLDGMTIYNPFHSIGLFSVFESELIRSADVYTGGFGAMYGGRTSAVMDIRTRDGDRSRFGGTVSASPFQAKAIVEGPIVRFREDGDASASFLLTAKHSLLDETSPNLYSYASDSLGLPFDYTDIYGKLSLLTGNGSRLEAFGFNFRDNVNYPGTAAFGWTSSGGGISFKVVPGRSRLLLEGNVSYSDYQSILELPGEAPNQNGINGFGAGLNFTYFGRSSELRYGFEITGFRTELSFRNTFGITLEQIENTTELSGYLSYRYFSDRLVIEPGLRAQFYASLGEFTLEPRLGVKLNATDILRIKLSAGLYSQNLISTVNQDDIVNLFVGFLSGPEEQLFKPGSTERADHKLQKAIHAVGGFEVDVLPGALLNVEAYVKDFTQLIDLNRNKLSPSAPDFVTETGLAYGVDISAGYEIPRLRLWLVYSLGKVTRDNGVEEYPAHFDRRHNINLVAAWRFGTGRLWEAGARWNYGSGFPFTQTQGFYGQYDFTDGLQTDLLRGNPGLGVLYSDEINGARLPAYHRLDVSLKRTVRLGDHSELVVVASITNAYDRDNIFYFDRVRFERIDQLPVIPSLGLSLSF